MPRTAERVVDEAAEKICGCIATGPTSDDLWPGTSIQAICKNPRPLRPWDCNDRADVYISHHETPADLTSPSSSIRSQRSMQITLSLRRRGQYRDAGVAPCSPISCPHHQDLLVRAERRRQKFFNDFSRACARTLRGSQLTARPPGSGASQDRRTRVWQKLLHPYGGSPGA